MAHKMRLDPTIKGIHLLDFPNDESIVNAVLKLIMYADDVTLFVRDNADLENVLSLINDFSLVSCLKITRNKTEAIWLRSLKQCADTHFDLKRQRQLKILGILFNSSIPASSIEEKTGVGGCAKLSR